jgi:hypothetical protein
MVFGGREKQNESNYGTKRNKAERHQQHSVHKYSLKKIYNASRKPAMPHSSAMTVKQPRSPATAFVFFSRACRVFSLP